MANPVYITYTSAGAKTPIALNYFQTPFNVTVATYLSASSTATYAIQYTLDNIYGSTGEVSSAIAPSSIAGTQVARWYDSANFPTGTSSAGVENFMFPVRAIRLNIAAVSSYMEFKVLQGM